MNQMHLPASIMVPSGRIQPRGVTRARRGPAMMIWPLKNAAYWEAHVGSYLHSMGKVLPGPVAFKNLGWKVAVCSKEPAGIPPRNSGLTFAALQRNVLTAA